MCILATASVLGQMEIPSNVATSTPEMQLVESWDRYLEAKKENDDYARKREFSEIQRQVQESLGTTLEQASFLFLEEGYRELDVGDYEDARAEFLNAAQLNPHLWPAYNGLAQIKLEREKDYRYYVSLCLKGFRSAFDINNTYFLLDAIIWFLERLLLIIKYSIVVFLFLLSFKYLRPCYTTTVNALEQKNFTSNIVHVLALIVMVLPLLLGLNLLLCAAGFLIILFPFYEPREKTTATMSVASYILTAFLLLVMNHIVTAKADPDFRIQLSQFYRGSLEEQIETLSERLSGGVQDDKVLFALGKLQKNAGQYSEALRHLERIPERSRYWALAQVNTGNVYFAGHEYQKAITAYEAALRAHPKMGVALYNLSITKSQLGDHREAEENLRRAKAADPELIDQVMIRTDMEQNSVIDANFNPAITLKEALSGGKGSREKPWYLFGFFMAPILFVVITLIAALFHSRVRHQRLLAKGCTKCGNLFFVSESPNHEWCSQCVNLYVRKGDLPSEAKINKYEEVQTFNRRKRQLTIGLQILFPGAKNILKGATWSGWLTLSFWVFLLVFSFSSFTNIAHPAMKYLRDELIFQIFIWGTTFFYWLIFGIRAIWQED